MVLGSSASVLSGDIKFCLKTDREEEGEAEDEVIHKGSCKKEKEKLLLVFVTEKGGSITMVSGQPRLPLRVVVLTLIESMCHMGRLCHTWASLNDNAMAVFNVTWPYDFPKGCSSTRGTIVWS